MSKAQDDAFGLFPSGQDFTNWGRNGDVYTPTGDEFFNTHGSPNMLIHIPTKNCMITDFRIRADISRIDSDGALYARGVEESKGATLSSALDLIESVQIYAGNGSGPLLFEINHEAGMFLQMMLDDKARHESDRYGYYKHWGKEARLTEELKTNVEDGYVGTRNAQIKATQLERLDKYRRNGFEALSADNPTMGSYTLLRFKDLPRVNDHIPLMFLQSGISIRIIFKTGEGESSVNRVVDLNGLKTAAKATPTASHTQCYFKLSNVKCYTDEAVPTSSYSDELTQQLQRSNKFVYKWYAIQSNMSDIQSAHTSTNIDVAG